MNKSSTRLSISTQGVLFSTEKLYRQICNDHFLPEKIILIGIKSLAPGQKLINCFGVKKVSFLTKSKALKALSPTKFPTKIKDKTLIFMFSFDFKIFTLLKNNMFLNYKTCCLFQSSTPGIDYFVHILPDSIELSTEFD